MRGLLPHVMVPGAILCRVVFLHLWAAMSAAQSPGYQPRRSLFMVLVLGTIDRCGLLSTHRHLYSSGKHLSCHSITRSVIGSPLPLCSFHFIIASVSVPVVALVHLLGPSPWESTIDKRLRC
jgi:hypothetical protein